MKWKEFSSRQLLFLTILVSLYVISTLSYEGFGHISAFESQSIETKVPIFKDPNLKAQLIFTGLEPPRDNDDHSPVSKMAFLGPDDILVLEKNTGQVRRIVNGTLLPEPLLDISVANERERGLLGIAIDSIDNTNNNTNNALVNGHEKNSPTSTMTYVFLYFTQSKTHGDGIDDCPPPRPYYCVDGGEPVGNRVYRYELVHNDSKLINPKMLLDLPSDPGPVHNGGSLLVGPDNNIYTIIGDVLSYYFKDALTETLNFKNGTEPDGRGGILRITQDGKTVREEGTVVEKEVAENQEEGILGNTHPLNKYYAYGIRNSFGMDFDPVTGKLWDTENGPGYGDEINLVEPGFNSGWSKVQGLWRPHNLSTSTSIIDSIPANYVTYDQLDLLDFNGTGIYSSPEFTWSTTVAPTALRFYDSDILGDQYKNDMFVADYNNGNIYHFELDKNRTALDLVGSLEDKVANSSKEYEDIIFAQGFGEGITDIEVSPDGYLYVLVRTIEGWASIYKVVPEGEKH